MKTYESPFRACAICSRSTCRIGTQAETGIDDWKYIVRNCFIITSPPPGQALLKLLDSEEEEEKEEEEEEEGAFGNFHQSTRCNASEYLNHQPVHFIRVSIEDTLCMTFLCRLS